MFGHDSLPSKIYSFGAKPPSVNDKLVSDQMWLAHKYRNQIVEEERERRKLVEEAVQRHFPELAVLEKELTDTDARREELRTALKKKHAEARSKKVSGPEKEEIDKLSKRYKELTIQRKEKRKIAFGVPDEVKKARAAVAKARKEKSATELAQQLQDAADRAFVLWMAAQPAAASLSEDLRKIDLASGDKCREMREKCGIFWGTYLAVEQSMSGKRVGAPPQFKRWNGDGKLALQVQGGMSLDDAFLCDDTRLRINHLSPSSWDRGVPPRKRHTVLHMRVGSEGREPIWAQIPFIMHRSLPPGCQIKWVYLIRRRVATLHEWRVQLVVSREGGFAKKDCAASGEVAVDVGWRLVHGGLRVAYWHGSDGEHGELVIPTDDLSRWSFTNDLQSIRSLWFDDVKAWLVSWMHGEEINSETLADRQKWLVQERVKAVQKKMRSTGKKLRDAEAAIVKCDIGIEALGTLRKTTPVKPTIPEALAEKLSYIDKWRSQARLAMVTDEWAKTFPDLGPEMLAVLKWWKQHDEHLYVWQECQRQRSQRWRDDVYRNFAAKLRRSYKTIIVEDVKWSELHRRPSPEGRAEDVGLVLYRNIAAVGRLVQLLSESAAEFVRKGAINSTKTCHNCGSVEDFNQSTQLVHTCSKCETVWDQDDNCCLNLLKSDWAAESASA